MQTVNVELFSINELDEKARQKAIEKERENCDVFLDSTVEYIEEILTCLGFESPKIAYSGFCSQGDGLSFVSDNWQYKKHLLARIGEITQDKTVLDCAKNLLELSKKHGYKIQFSIYRTSHRYAHHNTVSIDYDQDVYTLSDELYNDLQRIKNSLCRVFYRMLEKDYDYQLSDEYIIESLLSNEVIFLSSGKVWSN